ncbi:hemin-degrading factor [Rhodobacter maris]|uniref:Putative hemin transport protein n=1 Tax=Rhodobacter maris TaxID=446682 RepID=A0A285RJ04_9RHOB|nr:ChuX/HutX family heme-like substrate-binding protein [Rhodobacter maris]SOB93688.1 putative hemin transport protein [Rhodobacter maris]
MTLPSPEDIRAARAEDPRPHTRDLAARLGIAEAEIMAALLGHGATRIDAHPDALIPRLTALGPLKALTRNESCVIEKIGIYDDYRPGPHAALVVNEAIDLRIFPSHWVHGFALEEETPQGLKRSLQIFDAAGDAVHKIHLRPDSDAGAWAPLVAARRLPDQDAALALAPRRPPEPARLQPDRRDALHEGWAALEDTHQFLRLCSKLKMNRLGAYRLAGAPFVRRLAPGAVETLLYRAAEADLPIMIFVGNMGCIEIHTGPVGRVGDMGPWITLYDHGLDLHLRMDHIAEIYAVVKNTARGPAHSVEFFDARGALIAQIFGVLRADAAAVAGWNALVADLPEAGLVEAAQ